MLAELNVLRKLRPAVRAPASQAIARAREALAAEMAAESRALERRGGRWAARRWLVPSIVVVVLGAGGLATAGLGDWWLGGGPPDRPDQVAAALDFGPPPLGASTSAIEPQLELARTVARAPGASLVAVPGESREDFCIVRVPDGKGADGNCFGGGWPEFFTDWVHNTGSGRAWYLLGRVREPGAARLELFEEVTRPFEREEAAAPAVKPQIVDVGPGRFFLARVPESHWRALHFAYTTFSVVDENGAQIRRACRYIGPSPVTSLGGGGRMGPGPLDATDGVGEGRCPPSGSAVRAATMAPVPPRREDMAALPGRDLVNGGRFSLPALAGQPVILAVLQDLGVVETSTELLLELESFSRRHPDVQVVALVHYVHGYTKSMARSLGLGFPVVHVEPGANAPVRSFLDGHGRTNPFVVALDERGDVTGELAVPDPELGVQHALLTQQVLDHLLATTNSG